jgi:hypothetical protein
MWPSSWSKRTSTPHEMTLAAFIGNARHGRITSVDIHDLPHLLIAGMIGSGRISLDPQHIDIANCHK